MVRLIECSLMDSFQLQKWARFSFVLIFITTLPSLPPCHSSKSIHLSHSLTDGETIASPAGVFNLGFFTVGNAGNRYVGIWHENFSIENVVWVANRETPIPNHSGSIAIIGDGNIAVLDGGRRVLWSSNTTLRSNESTVELSDYGDLMLNNSGSIAWESFNHPCDTYLAGMKIWLNLGHNSSRLFTSWKTADDPSPGNFSLGIDPSAQLFIWEGSRPRWRSGQWNGQVFIGIPDMVFAAAYGFKLSVFIDGNKRYYYTDFNSSHRWVLTVNGTVKHLLYLGKAMTWLNLWEAPVTECEKYNRCGDYGSCTDGAAPICSCLKGFVPRFGSEWSDGNWTEGCVRRTPLQCEGNGVDPDRFYLMRGIKLPDSSELTPQVVNVNECGELCLRNCSCKAYSFVDAIGCMIWTVNLADINVFTSIGNDLYLRLSASEFNQGMLSSYYHFPSNQGEA